MSEHHHLYNRSAWRKLRAQQLSTDPLCRMHKALGQLVPAQVVDHIRPHRGDVGRFFDHANLQSLCKRCHDGHKQAQEGNADGILRGAGLDGRPLDLAHSWHAAARPTTAACSALTTNLPPRMARPSNGAQAGDTTPSRTLSTPRRQGVGGSHPHPEPAEDRLCVIACKSTKFDRGAFHEG